MWLFLWCRFLWGIVILPTRTAFLTMPVALPSPAFSVSMVRVLPMIAAATCQGSALFSMFPAPFTFDSNLITTTITFCSSFSFFVQFPLLITHFSTIACVFFAERQESTTRIRSLYVCTWTEPLTCVDFERWRVCHHDAHLFWHNAFWTQ